MCNIATNVEFVTRYILFLDQLDFAYLAFVDIWDPPYIFANLPSVDLLDPPQIFSKALEGILFIMFYFQIIYKHGK